MRNIKIISARSQLSHFCLSPVTQQRNDGATHRVSLGLIGPHEALSAAKKLLDEGKDFKVHTDLKLDASAPFLEVSTYGNEKVTPLELLWMVHETTHCDIGVQIKNKVEKRPIDYAAYTICKIKQDDPRMRKIIADYLESKLGGMERKDLCNSIIVRRDKDKGIILMHATHTNSHAKGHAAALAEHLSGELGIPDLSLKR